MHDFTKLREPFPAEDVEWRLQSSGTKDGKIWAMCLAYITNRAIMQRLDDVCGPENWQNKFRSGPHGGVICGISIKCDGEWVMKWDGAENTQVEAIKGGLSDSMKRAGYQWGIGRYLYKLEEGFAKVHDGGAYRGKTKDGAWFRWDPPALPKWALPEKDKSKSIAPVIIPEDKPEAPKQDPKVVGYIEAANTLDELKTVWDGIPKEQQMMYFDLKQMKKDILMEAARGH